MINGVIHEIKKISLNENHRFYFISKYIIDNFSTMKDVTIDKLAKFTYCSTSTINRFIKSLKLSGYKELTYIIKYSDFPFFENFQSSELASKDQKNSLNLIKYNEVTDSIKETYSLFLRNEAKIEEVITLLKKAEKIVIFSVGGTSNIARDFQEKLLRIGLNAIVVTDYHKGYFLSHTVNAKDFSIFISYSGETADLINLALICKKSNSPVLSISKYTNSSSLFKISDFNFGVISNEPITRYVSTSSRIALLFYLDMIFMKIFQTDISFYENILKGTRLNKF